MNEIYCLGSQWRSYFDVGPVSSVDVRQNLLTFTTNRLSSFVGIGVLRHIGDGVDFQNCAKKGAI